jgi:hypothetical protein
MFFTFPEDARWNAERQAVEFGVVIGEYEAWSGSRGACFNAYCRSGLLPSGALKRIRVFLRHPPVSAEAGCLIV